MAELTLSEIQQKSLQGLLKIKEICERENLHFFLIYGTLIGAVRHHGFIPWDDDIDVGMLREDYEKFIQYCIDHKKEIEPFHLMHYRTNKKYIYTIARLSDSRYSIDYNHAKKYGLGLFVDIYPFDAVSVADISWKNKILSKKKWIALCGSSHYMKSEKPIRNCLKFPAYMISRFMNISKLIAGQDRLSQKYNFDKNLPVSCVCWQDSKAFFPREWFENLIEVPFEGVLMPVSAKYDEILTEYYGDYHTLPPLEQRTAHHEYIAFEKIETQSKSCK